MASSSTTELDPVLMAVMANRVDGVVREMSNTLLRAARSAVLAVARDFSCAITTGDNQLFSSAEGLPVHIFGSHLQSASMCELHKDLAEGDAFLHNDPYLGNTHPADHMILVPVFFEGEHLFTACAKAHQADVGNSIPTTYHAAAKDVYEEGSVIFPCVRVQRNYKMIDDVIRMCEKRIRVPEQWYGDFLAELGAARIGERRLKEFCAKYGKETVKKFVKAWLDYSETRMIQAVKKLPKVRLENRGGHDPIEGVAPEGVPIKVVLDVDPDKAIIDIDLRDNVPCMDCGLNESEACAINNVVSGVFNCLDPDVPHNSGSFRRLRVHLKDDCVVGRPAFPHSCSVATTNVGDRLVAITQMAFAQLGDGWGLAEGPVSMGAGFAVVSGAEFRRNGEPYVNQMIACTNGGPASPHADGWVTLGLTVVGGLMYRDSIELDELKQPIEIKAMRLLPDSGGVGRYRGGPASEIVYGPRKDPMQVAVICDGQINPPRGVHGGGPGAAAYTYKVSANGLETKLPNLFLETLQPGEFVRGSDNGGGGYGSPLERDPKRVLVDVLERYVTVKAAREVYGVVFTGTVEDETLAIDAAATAALRADIRKRG